MRILLFSDTHRQTNLMEKGLKAHYGVELIIHLGDCISDAIKFEAAHKNIKHEYVLGNNDWNKNYLYEKLLIIEKKRLFITHGHNYNVKAGYEGIISKGIAEKVDAVFFGHTHSVYEQYSEGILLLNPGSAALYSGQDKPTYCLIDIENENIRTKFNV